MITLEELNSIDAQEAYAKLEQCCVSKTWVTKMVTSRPFSSEEALVSRAADIWFNECDTTDFKEAFTGHPKIGDVTSLQKKFNHTKDWANDEQSKVASANIETITALAAANTAYENKFGYIFIVSASGKSADEMLSIISTRLYHDVANEIYVAMNEQHKITVIRLTKLITTLSINAKIASQITTHALDTTIGNPARHMCVTLNGLRYKKWKPIAVGVTNEEGRIVDLLAPKRILKSGIYSMVFDTKSYYKTQQEQGFYPEVNIQFTVTDQSHYHIPLLISPFGYSTYRGS